MFNLPPPAPVVVKIEPLSIQCRAEQFKVEQLKIGSETVKTGEFFLKVVVVTSPAFLFKP